MNANMAEPIQIDLSAFYGGSIVPRWQDLLRVLAIVALSFATIGCSLRQDRDAPAPVAWAERTPLSAIETVSTPEQKCIGWPEQKYISDVSRKAPETGVFCSGIRLGSDYLPTYPR